MQAYCLRNQHHSADQHDTGTEQRRRARDLAVDKSAHSGRTRWLRHARGIRVSKSMQTKDVDGRNKSAMTSVGFCLNRYALAISKRRIEQELDIERYDRGGHDP